MKKVDPYKIKSDIVKEAIKKGWTPPDPEALVEKLHDTLPKLSTNWNGPLQVIADLIPVSRQVEAAQSLVAFVGPATAYQFLADVYLTDEQ